MTLEAVQYTITWEAAQRAIEGALRRASEIGIRVCAAVVDPGGNPVAFGRVPGAPLHSITLSEDKAYTAASFGLPTGEWMRELDRHSAGVRTGIVHRPRFIIFGGGIPIRVEDRLIGAIGVSGGSEEQDEECARAGSRCLAVSE